MPSSSTVCVRFFSSSSSSSGTKPSVRNRLGGMLATASRWVSALRKPARSPHSRSAACPPASRCTREGSCDTSWRLLFPEQSDPLDGRALGLQRLRGPLRVFPARLVPVNLIELLQQLQMLRIVERLLEGVVQRLHDLRIHAFRAHQAVRRIRNDIEAELLRGGRVPP